METVGGSTVPHPRRGLRARCVVALLLGFACATPAPGAEPIERDRATRYELERGRALLADGRLEAAARAFEEALKRDPEDARAHRALADVLARLGRADEARAHDGRAEALDPRPAAPEAGPLEADASGLDVFLVPPDPEADVTVRESWPSGEAGTALEHRLRLRLPGARVAHADPGSVAAARESMQQARSAISLRVLRVTCRATVKDGPFALASLRVAVALPDGSQAGPETVRTVFEDPPLSGAACQRDITARALEAALAGPAARRARSAPPRAEVATARWSTAAVRALFPGLAQRIEVELARGRARLAAGRLGEAVAAFEDAAAIDPEDPQVRAYLDDTRQALALSRELSAPDADPAVLDPQLSTAQRAAAEHALERERTLRQELLAALAVLDEDVRAPDAAALAALRVVTPNRPETFGADLARQRVGEIEVRAAYAPDGSVIATYYFRRGGSAPLVREEDTNRDGRPDRWIVYARAARSEIYEDGRGDGRPDMRFVFAPGGNPLERVELDDDGSGRPDRIFRYAGGSLVAEESDTNGDGRIDRFDRFDDDGLVGVREEDVNGDGEIDVRSVYRGGKLVRRVLSSPDLPES